MKEYMVVAAAWVEVAEGYGYWTYRLEEVSRNGVHLFKSSRRSVCE